MTAYYYDGTEEDLERALEISTPQYIGNRRIFQGGMARYNYGQFDFTAQMGMPRVPYTVVEIASLVSSFLAYPLRWML